MQNALADGNHFVTIRGDNWRFGKQRGRVRAKLPLTSQPHLCELAVLVQPGSNVLHYAARIAGSDTWAHFHHLQSWMHPIVGAFLDTLETYEQVVEMIEKTHQLTHGTTESQPSAVVAEKGDPA